MAARRAFALLALAGALVAACQERPADAPSSGPRVVVRAHRPRGPEVRCDPDRLVAPDVPTARAQCAGGVVKGCARLLALEEPSADTVALTNRVLGGACARDRAESDARPGDAALALARTCSCGAWGTASTFDRAREVEGIALLDEACTRGLLDACDQADLVAELCTLERRPMCDDLLAQGRVRTPPPGDDVFARPAVPPAALLGCFVVVEPGEELPAGAAICFAPDRVSWRVSWRGARGGWDQRSIEWRGWPGVGVFVAPPKNERLVSKVGAVTFGGARLAPADASVAREASALPSAKEVCARTRRCDEAIAARARPPRAPSVGDEPVELLDAELAPLPTTLRGCEDRLRGLLALPGAPAACR